MKYFLLLIFMSSCKDPSEGEVKPNKQVMTYELAKIAEDRAHKIPSDKLKTVLASGDGEFVYAVSDDKMGLSVLETNKGIWQEPLSDWTKIPDAKGRAPVNLANETVSNVESFSKGILFTLQNNQGLVVLQGFGLSNASFYPQGANNFKASNFNPMIVTKKDESRFIYLIAKGVPAREGVLFRTYKEPPKDDDYTSPVWDKTLKKKTGEELNTEITASTQDSEFNLLLADNEGIKRVLAADLGLTNKTLDNAGQTIYKLDDFRLDSVTKNDRITTMKLIDDKLLVVGFSSTEANNGGLAIANMNYAEIRWRHFGKGFGITINFIAPETIKQRAKTKIASVIGSDKGLLFMDNDGKMVELISGKGHFVTPQFINDQRAEVTDYENASSGFLGDRVPLSVDKYLGAAQDKNGLWYLALKGKSAVDSGLFRLDIKTDQVEPPKARPTMPD